MQTKPKSKSEKKRLAVQMAAFQKQQAELEAKKAAPLKQVNPDLPVAILVDIDGTLAKRGDRGVFDFRKSIDDTPFLQVKFLLDLIEDANRWVGSGVPKVQIILLTGREDVWKDVTNDWLNKHHFPFHKLYMRRAGDHRPSNIVKEEIYAGNIRGRYNVLFVIDDREQDVVMYRSHGLYVLQADNSRE